MNACVNPLYPRQKKKKKEKGRKGKKRRGRKRRQEGRNGVLDTPGTCPHMQITDILSNALFHMMRRSIWKVAIRNFCFERQQQHCLIRSRTNYLDFKQRLPKAHLMSHRSTSSRGTQPLLWLWRIQMLVYQAWFEGNEHEAILYCIISSHTALSFQARIGCAISVPSEWDTLVMIHENISLTDYRSCRFGGGTEKCTSDLKILRYRLSDTPSVTVPCLVASKRGLKSDISF